MFCLLAETRFYNYFRVFYEFLGVSGLFLVIVGAILFFALSLSPKGIKFIFIVFLFTSLLSSGDPDAPARTAAISVVRYALLFPVAVWGLISVSFMQKKVGLIGWLSFLYCIMYVPGWIANVFVGTDRMAGQFLLWFAIFGFLPFIFSDIEELRAFLSGLGWMCWLVVLVGLLFIAVSPGTSFIDGRLRSIWFRPNALGWSLFFTLIPLSFRAFIQTGNKYRIIDIISLVAALLMMVMSGTRTSGVGALILLFPLIRGRSFSYYALISLLILLIAVVIVSVAPLREMAKNRFLPSAEMDTSGRTDIWYYELRRAMEKPIAGNGIGAVTATDRPTGHNSYISIAVEAGFPTAFLFILTACLALAVSRRRTRLFTTYENRRTGNHVVLSIIAVMFSCFFESMVIGIGGAGVIIIWIIFNFTNGLFPVVYDEDQGELSVVEESFVMSN